MKLPLFYDADVQAGTPVLLEAAEGTHITKALRLRTGDEIALTDGKGQLFRATLEVVKHHVHALPQERMNTTDTPVGLEPGGAILPLYDELRNHKKIKHILVRHEQGAGHAAEGYARSSGKPGVVLVTSGPGATNMVTALTDAYMDSIPLVCVTGQVPTHLIGTDAFQECDTTGITRPCTKHNWLVKNIKDLPIIMHKAFHIATSGRPGPVLVDIPKDIQFQKTEYVN